VYEKPNPVVIMGDGYELDHVDAAWSQGKSIADLNTEGACGQ